MIKIKVDIKTEGLKRLGNYRVELQSLQNAIGSYLVKETRLNFEYGGRPQRWKPSLRAILQGGKTLIDTGNLWSSIHHNIQDNVVYVTAGQWYGIVHQYGTTTSAARNYLRFKIGSRWFTLPQAKIPARPFLVWLNEFTDKIKRMIIDYNNKLLGK